jgi:hypothetical protein
MLSQWCRLFAWVDKQFLSFFFFSLLLFVTVCCLGGLVYQSTPNAGSPAETRSANGRGCIRLKMEPCWRYGGMASFDGVCLVFLRYQRSQNCSFAGKKIVSNSTQYFSSTSSDHITASRPTRLRFVAGMDRNGKIPGTRAESKSKD